MNFQNFALAVGVLLGSLPLQAATMDPAALEARKFAALQDRFANPWPNPATSDDGKAAYCLAAYALNQGTAQADAYILGLSNDLNDYYFANVEFLRIHADPALSARMSPPAREKLERVYWSYIKANSQVARAGADKVWQLDESENHNAIRRGIAYLASQTLAKLPAYRGRLLDDGQTVEAHAAAWAGYWKRYFPARAAKGLEVEINSFTYVKYTLSCYYNLLDLTNDAALAGNVKTYLDLYWAQKAQTFLRDVAVVGGSAQRSYKDNFATGRPFWSANYFLGWHDEGNGNHPANIPPMLTSYRSPKIISALATGAKESFEVLDATWGISDVPANPPYPPADTYYVGFETDGSSGAVRHSTVTPAYVMGTTSYRPDRKFIALSEQNRAMGVHFASNANDRIFVHGVGTTQGRETGYAEVNGIAGSNCQIVWRDKRQYFSTDTRVFLSNGEVVNNEVVVGDWWFSRTSTAYVAIRIANLSWVGSSISSGKMQTLQGPWSPVIIECAPLADYPSFAAFQSAIADNAFTRTAGAVTYTSEAGDAFTVFPNSLTFPQKNGANFNYSPARTYQSPYLLGPSATGAAMVTFPGYAPLVLEFGVGSVEVEAESAAGQSAFPPFVTGSDVGGTTFIEVPNGVGNANSAEVTEPAGLATYSFELSRASDVTLEARVDFPIGTDNSFWYRWDDGPWTVKNEGFGGGWTWLTLNTASNLAAGPHTLEIAQREDGSRIDKFRLTGALASDLPPGTIRVVGTAEHLVATDPVASNAVHDFVVYDGPNRKLIVVASYEGGSGIAGVTWRGVPLEHAVTMPSSPLSNPSSIWYLDHPPIGKGDVVLTFNGATNGGSNLGVLTLQNAAPGVAFVDETIGNTSSYATTTDDTFVIEAYAANNNSVVPVVPPALTPLYAGKGYSGNGGSGFGLVREAGAVANDWGAEGNRPAISAAGFVSAPFARAAAGADQALTDFDSNGTETVALDGSGSTVRNGALVSYLWSNEGVVIANGVTADIALGVGAHALTLTVTDNLGVAASNGLKVVIYPISSAGVVAAVNAGGPAFTGGDGTDYAASAGFVGGTSGSSVSAIAGTTDDALYRSSVSGNFAWSRIVPNGVYTLALKFAETAPDVDAAGMRVFHVDAEGRRVVSDLDLFVAAPGANRSLDIEVPVVVNDGQIDVSFSPSVNDATVTAIELRTESPVNADADELPDQWELQVFRTLAKTGAGDEDSDGQSNLAEFVAGTDPKLAGAVFQIGELASAPGSFTLRWPSVVGRRYGVLRSGDPGAISWEDVLSDVPGTGGELSFSDSRLSGDEQMFYRVQVSLE